jgi:manganese oxidase
MVPPLAPTRKTLLLVLVVALFVSPSAARRSSGRKRIFYIRAEAIDWDYAPAGSNLCKGEPFGDDENIFVAKRSDRVGSVYRKALFRQYTDSSFQTPKPHPAHLGTLGPYIHAEAGDEIVVELQNAVPFPVNFEADNVRPRDKNPPAVAPNETATFHFYTSDDSAPSLAAYTSSMMHFYRSTVDGPSHISAGLFGPLIVTRAGEAAGDGRPLHVDHEFVTVLSVSNENESPYWPLVNAARAGLSGNETGKDNEELAESNLMHGINGMVYCNLPGLSMATTPSTTRWYAGAVGNEVDLHTLHWHSMVGLTLGGVHADSIRLLAQSTETLDFAPREAGIWLLHCHVNGSCVITSASASTLFASPRPCPSCFRSLTNYR